METVAVIVFLIYALLYIIFAIRSGSFKKSVTTSAVFGIGLLSAVHILGGFFNFIIPLNIYTLLFSAVTGLPGVTLVSLLSFIFI